MACTKTRTLIWAKPLTPGPSCGETRGEAGVARGEIAARCLSRRCTGVSVAPLPALLLGCHGAPCSRPQPELAFLSTNSPLERFSVD